MSMQELTLSRTGIDKGKLIWTLKDLPPLLIGDNLAFKAEGYQVPLVHFIGAESFHWALAGREMVDDELSIGDYSVHDSIDKGITGHLLSEYQHRHMRIYRPVLPDGKQDELAEKLYKRMLYYGDQKYDWKGVIICGVWVLLHKCGSNIEWWEHNSSKFWCLEFNNIVWRDMGEIWSTPGPGLVPDKEPPYPTNMERTPRLKLIWGTY